MVAPPDVTPTPRMADREVIQERFGILGSSQAIHNVIDRIRQVARADISVLVQGESGVGKELVANAIHALSPRRHAPLIIVNCGAIPEGLIESELFGAEKGAYTGAVERRTGYFEEADGGTVFLDEIGEMPAQAQVRLLRVLETGQFSRVGSSTTRTTDVRVIAATNKDLGREVQAGRFREDLYYRLSTVIIDIPPLRERKDDILLLFEHFVYRFAQKYNSPTRRLDESARQALLRYRWPGNVRELRNVAEQVVVLMTKDTVSAADLEPYLRGITSSETLVPVADVGGDAETRERELIYRVLLELRVELRELKEQIRELAEGGLVMPRRADAGEPGEYVIVRGERGERYVPLVEDVPYDEVEENTALVPLSVYNGSVPVAAPDGAEAEEGASEEGPLPTLEDAERDLIVEALRRFDGNRRQTSKALGISERTLYRKLKEMDVDL